MLWSALLTTLGLMTTVVSINRPVYKILLTQKGYTQFLQYELEAPVVREFTVCVWIRFHEFGNEQSIFSYVGGSKVMTLGCCRLVDSLEVFEFTRLCEQAIDLGSLKREHRRSGESIARTIEKIDRNHRLVRLWIDPNGTQLTVSFATQSTSVPIELDENLWRHVCLSYQSDYGAWALYIDSRLAICQVVQGFQRYVFPGGSVIFGYGAGESGKPNGLEGEIFGANMILISTIDRNIAMKNNPRQRNYRKNNMKWADGDKYVVLNDLQTDEIKSVIMETPPQTSTTPLNYIINQTPRSKKNELVDLMNDMEIFHLLMDYNPESERALGKKSTKDFENISPKPTHVMLSDFDVPTRTTAALAPTLTPAFETSTAPTTVTLSEFETPPSFTDTSNYYSQAHLESQPMRSSSLPPLSVSAYRKLRDEFHTKLEKTNDKTNLKYVDDLPDVEVPPPPTKDTKVYGQWTSSKYAGIVLDHLKRNNVNSIKKRFKIPATIPLLKVSDKYPYPSTFKHNVIRPPVYIRDNVSPTTDKNYFDNDRSQTGSHRKVHQRFKRAKSLPDINVKIIEEDIRSEIMNAHAKTKPRNVRIISRSQSHKKKNITKETDRYSIGHEEFLQDALVEDNQVDTDSNVTPENSLLNIMPFLKSVEFYTGDGHHATSNPDHTFATTENDIYAKIIAKSNNWHNINSHKNDYTTRRTSDDANDIFEKIADANKMHPSIRLKYRPDTNKIVSTKNEASILEGISLAMDVSNQSKSDQKTISLVKYNHGYLPGHVEKLKQDKSFHKHVKIGNALNENNVLGNNDEKYRQHFYDENEDIPDVQKSELRNKQYLSLTPLACKNIELIDHILYAHADGSIDMTHIVSPLKAKNVAVKFVFENYEKCSMEDSPLETNPSLIINWSKTPVRLFGGAAPKKTKDLCGFF